MPVFHKAFLAIGYYLTMCHYEVMSHEFSTVTKETYTFSNPEVLSVGKNPPKNEDMVGYGDTTLVLSDGATDKSGQDFDGRTGGEIAAELVTEVCLSSRANGVELVEEISEKLRALYERINPGALEDSAFRFAATLLSARIIDGQLIITQVGDSSFRINGVDGYTNNKLVDQLTANARKEYIETTGDIEGSRDFIMPLLKAQHKYQNSSSLPLGYGVIDGTAVPEQFVKVYTFPADSVHTIEIASDGYYNVFPDKAEVAAYEALHQHIEEVDPNKCKDFASTKLSDDRTVMIAKLQSA